MFFLKHGVLYLAIDQLPLSSFDSSLRLCELRTCHIPLQRNFDV